ncbi:hypothetical protein ACFPPA_08245 [Rhodanobacter ginsengisoli]|uniref:Uncharacterized protein n=1 Tax=Rhodanobacter ginsengisoli TaxID=418646 RepID=A0ABW0QLS2_9GAMM
MNKQKQRAATIFTIDHDGRPIAHVALSGTNQRAKILVEDLERVLAAGYSPCWAYTCTDRIRWYVQARTYNPRGRPRSVTIARLVVQAGKGQVVRYADGDHLNLLPENLLVKKGCAWMAVDWLHPQKSAQHEPTHASALRRAPEAAEEGRMFHRKFPQGHMTI